MCSQCACAARIDHLCGCCRRAQEEAAQKEIAAEEEAALMREQQYASKEQEVHELRDKVGKLTRRYQVRTRALQSWFELNLLTCKSLLQRCTIAC